MAGPGPSARALQEPAEVCLEVTDNVRIQEVVQSIERGFLWPACSHTFVSGCWRGPARPQGSPLSTAAPTTAALYIEPPLSLSRVAGDGNCLGLHFPALSAVGRSLIRPQLKTMQSKVQGWVPLSLGGKEASFVTGETKEEDQRVEEETASAERQQHLLAGKHVCSCSPASRR